ncbi:hypothetical protein [Nonomuraea sp. NPDC046570]|uniref:hypothetical protein n=1 Tax=Nonomuraea sp. NPDC046570 TaxID=3155255 RepID=UPI0033DAAF66
MRAVLRARPDDALASTLLASRLVQQITFWQNDESFAADNGEDEHALIRRRDEAQELYSRVLRNDPEDRAARAGMATLHAQFDESGRLLDELEQYDQFAYYELSYDMGSGSFQRSEIVIATEPALRPGVTSTLRPR